MHEPAAPAGPSQEYSFQYTELFSILNTLWSQSGRYTEVLLYIEGMTIAISLHLKNEGIMAGSSCNYLSVIAT